MAELIIPSRRRFLGLGLGLICAPAVVRYASLMSVKALPPIYFDEEQCQNGLLSINEIIREALKLWRNANNEMLTAHNRGDIFFRSSPIKVRFPINFSPAN